MMNKSGIVKRLLFLSILIFCACQNLFAQTEVASDCTITFNVTVEDAKANAKVKQSMNGATKVVYIKGTKIRSDLITPGFRQSTFFDEKSDSVIILREFGTSKYITYLTGEKRKQQSKKYDDITFKDSGEKKKILGYDCAKVVATLSDKTSYEAYYTPLITPSNRQFELQFKDLPGTVLEYEALEHNNTKIKYSASKISFLPVPIAMFGIPSSGYRIL